MKLLAVNYHYIRDTIYPAGIYPTSIKAFEQQVEILQRQYTLVSQATIADWVEQQSFPTEGNYCILTLDDGLKEQMEVFEWLVSKNLPAIFFVPSHPIWQHKVLPVHQLHYIRTQLDDQAILRFLQQHSDIDQHNFEDKMLENQYRYDDPLARKIKYYLNFVLDKTEQEAVMNKLFRTLVNNEKAFAHEWYMSETDLKQIASSGMLGAHGAAHVPLASLPLNAAEADINTSIEYLQSVVRQPILSFSYPFGGPSAVSQSLGSLLQAVNIKFAFTMKRGINTIEQLSNPFFLNRVDTHDAPGGKNPLPELC